jgi:hypothetical protein
MTRLAVLSYHTSLAAITAPLASTMGSNLGMRRAGLALTLVFVAIIGTFTVRDVLIGGGTLRADNHRYIPDDRAAQDAAAAYYADRREAGAVHPLTPAIQSEIIRDPYIRLFVPMVPQRHNPLIAEHCPEVPAFREGLRLVPPRSPAAPPDVSPLLDCLARLQPVSLNGVPLDRLRYRLTTDEASGLRGVVAFISVAGLEPGEHVLRVERLPRPAAAAARTPAERPPYLIRFWL